MYTGNHRTFAKVSNGILTGLTDQGKTWLAFFFIVLSMKIIYENGHLKNVLVVLNF